MLFIFIVFGYEDMWYNCRVGKIVFGICMMVFDTVIELLVILK